MLYLERSSVLPSFFSSPRQCLVKHCQTESFLVLLKKTTTTINGGLSFVTVKEIVFYNILDEFLVEEVRRVRVSIEQASYY